MPDFLEHQTRLLNLGSQGAGGDAEVMAKAGINNTYRRVLASTNQEMRKRDFIFNVTAPAQASVTGSVSENYVVAADSNDKLTIQVDNGTNQTVTLTAGTLSASQVSSDINSQTNLITVADSSGKVKISSNTYGFSSEVTIVAVSNDAYTLLGFSVGSTNGTGSIVSGLPLYAKADVNFDDPTNTRPLINITQTDFHKSYPGNTDRGSPEYYYHAGKFGVQAQPSSAATTISFVSSSASDNSTYKLTVVGLLNGNLVREKNDMNGVTSVTTTQTYDSIERIVKTRNDGVAAWTGNVTVTDSGSNTLSVIPSWVASPTYQWVGFFPIPDADITYTLSAMAYKPDLVHDEDWPEFDDDFHDLLDYGGAEEVLPAFGKPDYAKSFGNMFTERMREYRSWIDPKPNLVQQFADVQLGPVNLPRHPWIRGVHSGLAKGQ